MLRTLGANVAGYDDLQAAIDARKHELWDWRLEPVLIAWEGTLEPIELRLPADAANGTATIRLNLEDGTGQRWEALLAEAPVVGHETAGGQEYVALTLPGTLQLPHGYHRLTLEAAGRRLEATVICAPERCYLPPEREWGVFLPLYALHSERSWGIGDYTDFGRLAAWASKRGAAFIGTLPLLPSYLDVPFEPSPYAPVSRLFWNEVYIDPSLPFAGSQPHPDEDPEMPEIAQRLNASENVPYQEAMAMKRRSLTYQLRALSPESRQAFEAYKACVATRSRLRPFPRRGLALGWQLARLAAPPS